MFHSASAVSYIVMSNGRTMRSPNQSLETSPVDFVECNQCLMQDSETDSDFACMLHQNV